MGGQVWLLRVYLGLVYGGAAAVLVGGALAGDRHGSPWLPGVGGAPVAAIALFALLSYAGERATLPLGGSVGLSLTTPVDIAALLLFPLPVPALVVAAAGLAAQATRRGAPAHKRAFNVAHPTLVVGLCGLLWPLLASPAGRGLPALALLLGAYYALDVGVLLGVLSLDARRTPWALWRETRRSTVGVEVASAALGALGAVAWRADPALLALGAPLAWALRAAVQARATAEEAVEVRDAFLTAGAHDLRTPLTVLLGRVSLVRLRLDGGATPERDWLEAQVASLEGAARRMAATVEEMDDAAQLQMGQRLALRAEPLDVGGLAREVAAMTAEAARAAEGSVVVDTPAGLWVTGDRRRLERVVQNIVGNALKYSPGGTPVRVGVRRAEAGVAIVVEDRGVGIPAAELPRIFERFYRASTAGGVAGTGIGLAGAKAIVEQHGGTLRVESAVGRGTVVTVALPDTAPRPDDGAERAGGQDRPMRHAV